MLLPLSTSLDQDAKLLSSWPAKRDPVKAPDGQNYRGCEADRGGSALAVSFGPFRFPEDGSLNYAHEAVYQKKDRANDLPRVPLNRS